MKRVAQLHTDLIKTDSSRNRSRRILVTVANIAGHGMLAVVTCTNLVGPERWWGGSLNLYLPQWIWGLPAIVLLAITGIMDRRRIWMPLLSFLWIGWPIMGLCVHWPGSRSKASGVPVRVMTYNVKWGRGDQDEIRREVEEERPDILMLQDAGGTLPPYLASTLTAYHVVVSGQYVLASRFPIVNSEDRSISFRGMHHHYLQSNVQIGRVTVAVFCVHLLTPREGLSAVRGGLADGISELETNTDDRLVQAKELADDIARIREPVILAGDLNAPPFSLVLRDLKQAGLKDAFEEAGWGYGYTYGQSHRLRLAYLRIDHILANGDFSFKQALVGNSTGSEHRPVIADLLLRDN